jgi:hypothetical protein
VEIATSGCGECEIDEEVHKWLNVGMSEKPGNQVRYVASVPKSSFVINSLFKDLATVVHSGARQGGCSRDISAISVLCTRTVSQERRARNSSAMSD